MDAGNENKNNIFGGKLRLGMFCGEIITPKEFNEMLKLVDPWLRE